MFRFQVNMNSAPMNQTYIYIHEYTHNSIAHTHTHIYSNIQALFPSEQASDKI